jgi:sulfur carrier protein ThiS
VKVTVHLHTILQRQTPEGLVRLVEIELPQGGRVIDILSSLAISMPPETLILAVNGRVVDIDQLLVEGDQVNIMPAISGGRDLLHSS